MLAKIHKRIQEIETDDLSIYLTEYQLSIIVFNKNSFGLSL